jgi:hypothetical protein
LPLKKAVILRRKMAYAWCGLLTFPGQFEFRAFPERRGIPHA